MLPFLRLPAARLGRAQCLPRRMPAPSPSSSALAQCRPPWGRHWRRSLSVARAESSSAGGAEAELSPRAGDQVSQVASILSGHVEALTAINVELLKAALVGSAAAPARAAQHSSSAAAESSPEGLLEAMHDAVLAAQRDSLHLMGEAEREAWERASWEVYHAVQAALQRLLFQLQVLAADMGSNTGAAQAAECLAHGVLVPRDEEGALRWYARASDMGNSVASLKCGIAYFQGQPPAGQDPTKAYDYFSRALDQVNSAVQAHQAEVQRRDEGWDKLTAAQKDSALGSDGAYSGALGALRASALTWLGRCYLEAVGVPRDVARAAELFRQAGNREELRELAMLKIQFEGLDLGEVE